MEPLLNTTTRSSCALDYDFKSKTLFWFVVIFTILVDWKSNWFLGQMLWKRRSIQCLSQGEKGFFFILKHAGIIISFDDLESWWFRLIQLLGDPIIAVITIVIIIMVFVSINMVSVCIMIFIRSVVVEEGVVTADGLAVDWVSLLWSFILDKSVQIYNVCHCL